MRKIIFLTMMVGVVMFITSSIMSQPIMRPEPLATIEGIPGTNFRVGADGFRIGDINGDGFPDLVTRSNTRPNPGEPAIGCMLVYYSDVTGALSTVPDVRLFNPGAPAGPFEDPFSNGFAAPAFDVGDVNGDGFDDVIVGATMEWGITAAQDTITRAGAVYIYFGASDLSGDVHQADVRIGHPDFDRPGRYITPTPDLRFGWRVKAGDFDNDGIDDLVVSEHGGLYSYIVKDVSEAVDSVHALPDTVDNWSFRYVYKGPITTNDQPFTFKMPSYWHNTQGSSHGMQVADFNGDGIDDFLLSCYGAYDLNVMKGPATSTTEDSARFFRTEQYGKVLFYYGGSDFVDRWQTFPDLIIPKQDTTRGEDSWQSELMGYLYELSGQLSGDYNGDGYTDFMSSNIWPRGIFKYAAGLPQKWLFFGGPGFDNIAEGTLGSTVDNSGRNWRLAWGGSIGDINGDGYDDYLFSSHRDSTDVDPVTGERVNGEYYLYLGGATIVDKVAAKIRPMDPDAGAFYGLYIPQPLWDMDGDGIIEWAAIAHAWGDSSQGKIYFYKGDATITSVESDPLGIVRDFQLAQNYPNPFNPETSITYSLPITSFVKLEIFDLLGRKIRTLVSGKQSPGKYSVRWDGRDEAGKVVSSGAYFYRLKAGDYIKTRKMVLLR